MRLRVGFINCHNLFPVGVSPRGPQTSEELASQIDDITATLGAVFEDGAPHLVGLCEVGSDLQAEAVRSATGLSGPMLWSGPPPVGPAGAQTGLAILHDDDVLRVVGETTAMGEAGAAERQKWMGAAFQFLDGSLGAFWFVVNHWKSNLGGTSQTDAARMRSAREIGQFYMDRARALTEAMILVGDFNCEPGARPLHEQKDGDQPNTLRSDRERALVLRERNRLAYFYNPMWRFMGEADPHETADQPGYQNPRLIGTHRGNAERDTDWSMWDHLMVSKPVLRGPALRLAEATVRIVRPTGNASDHCAVGAEFEY
jgi:exonuclease III